MAEPAEPATPSSSPPLPPPSPASHHSLPLTSHDTALALLPPAIHWPRLDRLRALYDKAYRKWPPHVNLLYPFVQPDALNEAVSKIASRLAAGEDHGGERAVEVCLDRTGVFPHRRDNTIYLCDEDAVRGKKVVALRRRVMAALEGRDGDVRGRPRQDGYKMHLTVAQSEDVTGAAHKFLVEKVGMVPEVRWTAAELAVLVRERLGNGQSVMRLWGTIGLADWKVERLGQLGTFYEEGGLGQEVKGDGGDVVDDGAEKDQLHSSLPYCFDDETLRWVPFRPSASGTENEEERPTLTVASYNVLAEFEWPPSDARYPFLVKNILAENAAADVLVLQEVTDGFLSYLLADENIREAYPYCSHGPPNQDDIEPLPSHLNIVVLSTLAFDWEFVSFRRKHKGAIVARFKGIGRSAGDKACPVILTAVHLSHGLTDGAVASKKTDIKRITGYLAETYPGHPWILAGDFNVTTSLTSIETALEKKSISALTADLLRGFDQLFAAAELEDAWRTTVTDKVETDNDDGKVQGEHGATWDPKANDTAAAMAGTGGNTRPQRYDRILVRGEGLLETAEFNMFGFLTESAEDTGSEVCASDHWGIRCTLNIKAPAPKADEPSEEISGLVVPVHGRKAPESLARPGSVEDSLVEHGVIPSKDEAGQRKAALDLLKRVLLDTPDIKEAAAGLQPAVVVVPVGSYALDVWTSSSDMDILCIGPFSTHTFFALAAQRLRKAAGQGIRILRRVRANTGTMLEIEVHGIKMDLQYCPATSVAERWPQVLTTPASDPVWSLSAQTLSKLKAVRDMEYLRSSVPDLDAFRVAHRFIKIWAKSRGIYSARFGFLSGIQISILLARVQKLVTRDSGPCSVEDLLTTFFAHYAPFDWSTQLVFDPLFHRTRLPYTRTLREPLAILGYFPPTLNTALAASVPSVKTLAAEFRRASTAIASSSGPVSSWSALLAAPATAAADFLAAHKTYICLDVQYWGMSRSRGAQLFGWFESRCVGLLVDVHRRAPDLHVRMWPGRFVEVGRSGGGKMEEQQGGVDLQEEEEEDRDFRGYYLAGLDKADPDLDREGLKRAFGALQTALARFETQMRADEKYFDARSCWLSAAVLNRAELGELEVDQREFGGEYTAGEEEEDDEEEEEEVYGEGSASSGQDSEHEGSTPNKGKKKKGAAAKRQIAVVDLRTDKTKKFRTAADAMNRIRWDSQLDSSEYVIGYEDRFTGAQEKALDAWKGEQTDEEFIPQHRILYFKRISDGRIVWDRRTRLDELFGNGA